MRDKAIMLGAFTHVPILALFLLLNSAIASAADPIVTESTTNSTVTTNGSMSTKVESPPPSAISPQFSAGSNSDLCTIGAAGAVQTQILGISMGTTFTEENCIRLKNAKTLYDMGMKVAAVSVMCQDRQIFDAMMMAGTPCPYDGLIGSDAKAAWSANEADQPGRRKEDLNAEDKRNRALGIIGGIVGAIFLF